ncbi:uncharacterized protein LOC104902281 [Beta vulgaris subsp. vulgaris]|uniref:uncharacterized protein LOC104902281 n=1 Tax=Beta vulgaris subsp. vulgaris TaxID=3555 RepID=UPI00053F92E4|nr:uncharacterized protein LOC104902281 [Beta vulgaris subsp. vulgaris]
MAIESNNNSQIIAKKVWSILRIMLMMVKKGICKSKLIMDFNLIFKRGNELASKAINGLIIHHNSLICRPNNSNNHFISPKEYEFSCSNSPELGPFQVMMAHHHKRAKPKHNSRARHNYQLEDPTTVAAVQHVLEILNVNEGPITAASPLGQYSLPGFGYGKSPSVRQLRITDSPFPLKDGKGNKEEEEEDVKVNKAADEFIKKFYKNLMMQKSVESPYHKFAH